MMKKLIFTTLILCLLGTINQAQEQEEPVKIVKQNKGVVVSLKDAKDATIYIDGKKYDKEILRIIDVDKIESIQVFKGEEAINAYGVDKVILVTTKKTEKAPREKVPNKTNEVKLTFRDLNYDDDDASNYPVIIIDGKTSDQNALKALSPNDIYAIQVLKDEKSSKKYNSDNGVIIVTTNKKNRITISGYVTDGDDNRVEGVTIIVDGLAIPQTTNKKGFYKIKVKPGIKTLMVYSMAHGGLEVEFTGRTMIDFILSPNTTGGSKFIPTEELIDIGYGSSNKKDLTNSVASFEPEASKSPKYATIYQMIAGRFPGVSVSGTSIVMRGMHPIFMVDGVSTTSISMINPNDVKSINVLKGSAAAIYGVRGAGGVILINTKNGSDKK